MKLEFRKSRMSLAVAAAISATTMTALVAIPEAQAAKTPGQYVTGDFHNHTTCSDGSISMQKLVKKATDKIETPWGLDWFVQAGHGGNGNRNCTLVEDATLDTPAYPYVAGVSPSTTWANSIGASAIKGSGGGVGGNGNMWRWQSIQEYQYAVMEYLSAQKNLPLFLGLESVVAGHEHTSMSVITGQIPAALDTATLPGSPANAQPNTTVMTPSTSNRSRYTPLGNADALAKWSYCFDRGDTDTSRGNVTGTSSGNNWDCSVTGSLNAASPEWNGTAFKLGQGSGVGTGTKGHTKTVEGIKWMNEFHPNGSYYVPAHLERAGRFNPDGNNGFNVEHLRNFNNAGPTIAFGMETQPGHGASANRGEYQPNRQTIQGVLTDSVGTTTYGGTGVYGAQVGGLWDSMLGEGRNFWFFASSDWHNRGSFGADDRRTTQDFLPGEYQRNYTMVRNGADKLRPQTIVDGLRSGNNFAASGQIIDRLAFVACSSYAGIGARTNASVEAIALAAAQNNTDIDKAGCATMGEKLVVRPGADIVVSIVVRDPSGTSYSPYTFANPSLLQIGVNQPLNMPVLDHIDVIRGLVTGYKTPGAADYSGTWPVNGAWLDRTPTSATFGQTQPLSVVPIGTRNDSSAVIKTFNGTTWTSAGGDLLKMTFRIPAVTASQYVRLRGTNMPPAVPFETDASGNPLTDIFTNAGDTTALRIPCTTVHSPGNQFDGCPDHMATATGSTNPILGQKAVSYDVAAWSDLWFYSNPIYVQVNGSTIVAGVQ